MLYDCARAVVLSAVVIAVCGLCLVAFGEHRGVNAITFLPVVWSARYIGRVPGLVAAVVSALAVDFFFIGPPFQLGPEWGGFIVRGIAFIAVAHIASAPTGRRFWRVSPSGNYEADCKAGARIGAQFLAGLRVRRDFARLGWVVREMIWSGRFGGAEAAFLRVVSEAAAEPRELAWVLQNAQDDNAKSLVVETESGVASGLIGMKQ